MKPIALFISNDNEYTMQFEENGEELFCVLLVKNDSFVFDQCCIEGEQRKNLVRTCVEAFHESRRTLYQDSEPMVSVVDQSPVASTKKRLSPKRLEVRDDRSEFRADMDCEGKASSYDFKVNDRGFVLGVEGDNNFWRDLGGEMYVARPLFRALTAFYELRCAE